MGKYKTYVGTGVAPLYADEKDFPNIRVSAPLNAVLSDEDISEHLIDGVLSSLAVKSRQAVRYAENTYTYGLPNHNFINDDIGQSEVQTLLDSLYPGDVTIAYHHFTSLHPIHVAFNLLIDNYGYDPSTNEIATLSASEGYTVYLENIVAVLPDYDPDVDEPEQGEDPNPGQLILWETAPNQRYTPWTNPSAGSSQWGYTVGENPSLLLYYAYDDGVDEHHQAVAMDMSAYDIDKVYFHTKFTYEDAAVTYTKYFTYEYGAGTYSTLDALTGTTNADIKFMPFIFFIHNKTNLVDESLHETDNYKTSKRLANILGFDYQDFGEKIQEDPAIADVEECQLIFAIPINSTHELGIRYLYHFFEWLYENEEAVSGPYAEEDPEVLILVDINKSVVIADSDFRMDFNYGAISSVIKTGSIGEIGFTSSEPVIVDRYIWILDYDPFQPGVEIEVRVPVSVYKFSKQINETEYREIRITNLELLYEIEGKSVNVNIAEDSTRFLIPVNTNLIKGNFSAFDQDIFYSLSMHVVANSLVRKYLHWYETPAFLGFVNFVALSLAIITAGQSLHANIAVATWTSLSAIAISVLVITFKLIILPRIYEEVLTFIAEEIGLEELLIIIAAIYVLKHGKVAWAEDLLEFTGNLVNPGIKQIDVQASSIASEISEIRAETSDLLEEIKALENSMDSDTLLDINMFIHKKPNILLGEKPDMFFKRTIHAGNVGTYVYDYLHHYVDINLRLPEFQETIRSNPNE